MILLSQIKVSIDVDDIQLKSIIANKLKVSESEILDFTIQKRSLDARKKDNIVFVYNFIVSCRNEQVVLKKNKHVQPYVEKSSKRDYSNIKFDSSKKIAIVGFGPAGMFSALSLSEAGIKCDVYERGEQVEKRIKSVEQFTIDKKLNTESNIQFGEGGAGTFSDGKLTNRKKDIRGKWLFQELVDAGAPQEILYVNNPHIGTDLLVEVVKNIREKIIELGSNIMFESKIDNLKRVDDKFELSINDQTKIYDYVILAIGHSSRDTFEMLYNNGFELKQKPFAVGFRIEHKQSMINKSQYGENYSHPRLGSAEYKLTNQTSLGRGVYTFCMCPGGTVVPASSEENMLVVNGMSEYKRDKINANSALLVTVTEADFKSEHPLAGMEFQRVIEKKAFELGGSNYDAPVQTVSDFIHDRKTESLGEVLPSYPIGTTFANMRLIYPSELNDAFIESFKPLDNKLKGFSKDDAILTGVETRSSSPVRILRDNVTLESVNHPNFYPTGEGAGYAGGIVSAAIDGIRVAEKILIKLKKNEE